MSSYTFDPTIPAASHNPSVDQPNMQLNNASIDSILGVDHITFNTNGGGYHQQVTFNSDNVPAVPTLPPVLFTNTINGLSQLFYYSGDATHSSGQYQQNTNGSTFLLGGIILKWGMIENVGSPYSVTYSALSPSLTAFPTNCFGVFLQGISSTPTIVGTPTTTGFTASGFAPLKFYFLSIGN